MPQALLPGVRLDELDLVRRASRELEVANGLGVDREDRARRTELGRHVADRGAVGEREPSEALAVELDELAHHSVPPKHLGDGEHQVGGGRSFLELADQLETDDLRDQHRHRLAEHRRLCLDPADSPAEHAEPVDHRRVRIRSDERVGIRLRLAALAALSHEHHPGQVLEVDLVDDSRVRRDDLEVPERPLPPAQERVALAVAVELELRVVLERPPGAERVDLDRVVDHELGRHERVDLGRVTVHLRHRVAHRGEVDDRWHPGEVLHQHPRRRERDLLARVGLGIPPRERLDVLGAHGVAVLVSQQVLQQDLQ